MALPKPMTKQEALSHFAQAGINVSTSEGQAILGALNEAMIGLLSLTAAIRDNDKALGMPALTDGEYYAIAAGLIQP